MIGVPCFARAAQHHVELPIVVSGRSKPILPSQVTLLYHYGWFVVVLGTPPMLHCARLLNSRGYPLSSQFGAKNGAATAISSEDSSGSLTGSAGMRFIVQSA